MNWITVPVWALEISATNYSIYIILARKLQHPRNAKWLYTKCIWLCADACRHIHLMCFVVQIINTHRWQYWNMYSVLPELASSVLIVSWLRYSSYWKLSLQNHSCNIPSESSWHQEVRNHHIFLWIATKLTCITLFEL